MSDETIEYDSIVSVQTTVTIQRNSQRNSTTGETGLRARFLIKRHHDNHDRKDEKAVREPRWTQKKPTYLANHASVG